MAGLPVIKPDSSGHRPGDPENYQPASKFNVLHHTDWILGTPVLAEGAEDTVDDDWRLAALNRKAMGQRPRVTMEAV